MLSAREVIRSAEKIHEPATMTITLGREDRFRRRAVLKMDQGEEFLLDLAEATYFAHGDRMLLEDGRYVCVQAAAEPLMQVVAGSTVSLSRLAWHIGNRHTPAEITDDNIFVQEDHVLAEMLRGLGASVAFVSRPFEPEGGAYGGNGSLLTSHHHGSPATHDHGDGHAHG